jgi:hypothetical protein
MAITHTTDAITHIIIVDTLHLPILGEIDLSIV